MTNITISILILAPFLLFSWQGQQLTIFVPIAISTMLKVGVRQGLVILYSYHIWDELAVGTQQVRAMCEGPTTDKTSCLVYQCK